jgi:hypothetical protein
VIEPNASPEIELQYCQNKTKKTSKNTKLCWNFSLLTCSNQELGILQSVVSPKRVIVRKAVTGKTCFLFLALLLGDSLIYLDSLDNGLWLILTHANSQH